MDEAVAAGKLAAYLGTIDGRYAELHYRLGSPALWSSVADEAPLLLTAYAAASKGRERRAAKSFLAALRLRAGS